MSKLRTIKLTCPDCGEEFDFDLYESVNVTLDPELKEKVLDGSIFAPVCPKCGHFEVLIHPFLYHDMDKKYMIQLNSYADLMDFKEEFVNHNKINEMFPGLIDDTKVIGVTSLADMITTITALDNDLDWRVVQLALLYMQYDFIKYCNDNKRKIKNINYSGLTGQKDEEGNLTLIIDVGEGDENEQFYSPFPMPVYNHCLKEYKERLDLINPFVFDAQMRDHFCNFYEEDFQTQEEHKNPYVYVERNDGSILLCDPIPTYLEDKIDIDSLVLIDRPNGERELGKIKRIVDWNFLCISIPVEYRGRIVAEYNELHMITTADSNSTLGQDDLVKKLVEFKNKEYKVDNSFPLDELQESNMFICSMTTAQFNFDDLVELIEKNEITGDVKPVTKLQKIERDGKIYLAAYTDPYYLPSKDEFLSNSAFCFDSLVRIVKNDPRYSGIIINQYDEDIVLDIKVLRDYIEFRTLFNRKRLFELLEGLSEKEKEYVGELSLKVFKSSYLEGLKEESILNKLKISKKTYDKAMRRAYATLKPIIYARY